MYAVRKPAYGTCDTITSHSGDATEHQETTDHPLYTWLNNVYPGIGLCGLFLVFALLFFSSIPMKVIPTQFSLLFTSILQNNVSIYGIVSVVSVVNYTACFEEHSIRQCD